LYPAVSSTCEMGLGAFPSRAFTHVSLKRETLRANPGLSKELHLSRTENYVSDKLFQI
jgi:hypothetical protein